MKQTIAFTSLTMLLAATLVGCGDSKTEEEKPATAVPETVQRQEGAASFETCMEQALGALARGDAAAATQSVGEALEQTPDSAEAVLVRGQAALKSRDFARARADFAAVAGDASLPAALRSDAWAARGVAEMAQKAGEQARISFLQAIRLNSRNASARYHLGKVLREYFHFDGAALEQFMMAAGCPGLPAAQAKKIKDELIPELSKASKAFEVSVVGKGKCDEKAAKKLIADGDGLLKRKMTTMALKKYEEAFKADRSYEPAALKYVTELRKAGKSSANVEKAFDAYRVLFALRPAREDYYYNAAQFAFEKGRWSVAVSILDRGLAYHPTSMKLLDLQVSSLQKAGKEALGTTWSGYRAAVKAR